MQAWHGWRGDPHWQIGLLILHNGLVLARCGFTVCVCWFVQKQRPDSWHLVHVTIICGCFAPFFSKAVWDTIFLRMPRPGRNAKTTSSHKLVYSALDQY